MGKFKNSIVGTVIILALTCLLVVFALAYTNKITAPIIKATEAALAEQAKMDVLPTADGFVEVDNAKLSGDIAHAYQAINGTGYVFETSTGGFGGPVKVMVGITASGEYSGITILSHTETPGLGSKVAEPEYLEKYISKNDPNEVDNITSATVTSLALKRTLTQASKAFTAITGISTIDGTTDASTSASGTTEETDETTEATGETDSSVDEATEATAEVVESSKEGESK